MDLKIVLTPFAISMALINLSLTMNIQSYDELWWKNKSNAQQSLYKTLYKFDVKSMFS